MTTSLEDSSVPEPLALRWQGLFEEWEAGSRIWLFIDVYSLWLFAICCDLLFMMYGLLLSLSSSCVLRVVMYLARSLAYLVICIRAAWWSAAPAPRDGRPRALKALLLLLLLLLLLITITIITIIAMIMIITARPRRPCMGRELSSNHYFVLFSQWSYQPLLA